MKSFWLVAGLLPRRDGGLYISAPPKNTLGHEPTRRVERCPSNVLDPLSRAAQHVPPCGAGGKRSPFARITLTEGTALGQIDASHAPGSLRRPPAPSRSPVPSPATHTCF